MHEYLSFFFGVEPITWIFILLQHQLYATSHSGTIHCQCFLIKFIMDELLYECLFCFVSLFCLDKKALSWLCFCVCIMYIIVFICTNVCSLKRPSFYGRRVSMRWLSTLQSTFHKITSPMKSSRMFIVQLGSGSQNRDLASQLYITSMRKKYMWTSMPFGV